MKASDARKLTEEAKSLQGEFLKKETEQILALIQTSASKGLESIMTSQTHEVVQKRLRELGYKVKHTSDQREGDFLTVSW